MKDLIRNVVGVIITLMVLSFLLGSFLVITVVLPQQNAYAQTFSSQVEEEALAPLPKIMPKKQVEQARGAHALPNERLVIPEVPVPEEAPIQVTAYDLAAAIPLQEQEKQGTLTPAQGGFAENIWQKITRVRAENLLKEVQNQGVKSKTLQHVLKSLLLSTALPPAGPSAKHWLGVRAQALQTMGFAQDAHFLLNRVSSVPLSTSALDQIRVGDLLLFGAYEKACSHIQANILNTDAPYWQQALLVCHALENQTDKLGLALKLVTPQEQQFNPLLYQLLTHITEGATFSPRLSVTDILSPLHIALYQKTPTLINPEVIQKLPDVTLRQLAQTQELDISLRLQAAERLVNSFDTKTDIALLNKLYESVPFSAEMVEAPVSAANQEVDGSKARALLWQAAQAITVPSGKALALKLLWQRAEKDALEDLPTKLLPNARGIKPEKNLAWFSPYVIKTALKGNRLDVAQAWWAVLSGNRSLSRGLSVERTDIAMAFSLLDGNLEEKTLDAWWKTQPLHTPADRFKVVRMLALIEALDLHVPADFWYTVYHELNDAYTKPLAGPGAIWLRLLATALEEGNTGEALLMLAEPLVYAHVKNLPPQGAANIVAGLTYLGLRPEAQNLALEAIFGN